MSTPTSRPVPSALSAIAALSLAYFLIPLTLNGNAAASEVAYSCDRLSGYECDDPNCPGCQAFFKACSYGSGCDCGAGIDSGDGIPYRSPETSTSDSSSGLNLSQQFGGGSNQFAVADAPNMFGDTTLNTTFLSIFEGPNFLVNTRIPIGAGDRRYKISDNQSPLPKDRVFFTYHHFHNAVEDVTGTRNSLDRYTFGLEKTLFNEQASFEIRVPFANGLNSDQIFSGSPGQTATEFGNILLAFKALAYKTDQLALSLGLGVTLPVADDARIELDNINRIYDFHNEAVYLQPFLGMLYAPDDRLFVQGFAGLDFDTNGDSVTFSERDSGGSITVLDSGNYRSQDFLLLDLSIGYWAYRNRCAHYITGVAPIVELHYLSTINDTDSSTFDSTNLITNSFNRMDFLNITGGLHFAIGDLSSLRVISSAPLRDGVEAFFDAEVAVQFNRRF
jgi:hypothetical protein